ncbi:unnamed protein product [Protopolystoma xenopodis]|uniref:Uncharacterized protein n=1 Tax=Protopolystoma xenopodis TaxID=117903 RepID=A0A3S5C0S4_9PLAT|nr:unnamed protein product [Protopolystoma xenopodis]
MAAESCTRAPCDLAQPPPSGGSCTWAVRVASFVLTRRSHQAGQIQAPDWLPPRPEQPQQPTDWRAGQSAVKAAPTAPLVYECPSSFCTLPAVMAPDKPLSWANVRFVLTLPCLPRVAHHFASSRSANRLGHLHSEARHRPHNLPHFASCRGVPRRAVPRRATPPSPNGLNVLSRIDRKQTSD